MKFKILAPALLSLCFLLPCYLNAADFTLVSKTTTVSIIYDSKEAKIDSITAHLLAEDIERVTGVLPKVFTDVSKAKGNAIIIGSVHSKSIITALGMTSTVIKSLTGKWECYGIKLITHFSKNINNALVIAGSNNRGTAYGVFSISENMGVSPWYWWADVHPKQQQQLSINVTDYVSSPPSVKYRGIFLNDEDWGLQPWAAKTFEPETGDIGPKTYAKIFELLLRLKANLIWPAMHPSTKAFYHYPGNAKVAADYSIIVGSSHAEPMLRNNVGEWDEKTMGAFNYITNKQKVYNYWEERVKESSTNDAIYTIGMRGVHDSGIEGVKTPEEAVPLLQQIFKDQREMLQRDLHKNVADIPQVFTAYKEVLDIYDANLKLPDDVTLVWPDDNYGYIQRLNNKSEQKRSGGSGVYYHASYWGRPHDYLWLSTTHPGLIREEMMKAYAMKADKLWVLNVGDIKPLEYNSQMFMDMAYDAEPFRNTKYTRQHLLNWAANIFGKDIAPKVQNILWQYYQLAFERRPEFMGWSQTEPTTQTKFTEYNHFYFGDEAQQRIDKYQQLEREVNELRQIVNKKDADAFYELVYYPVVGASLMNKKFLYRDKSYLYAKQNRTSAYDYAKMSRDVYDSIVQETDYYNQLAEGKWRNIMSMKPRDLPVYQPPVINNISINKKERWSVAPEGSISKDSLHISSDKMVLPQFSSLDKKKYFIDIFLTDDKPINWSASTSANWISLSQANGALTSEFCKKQQRIWVSVDWSKAPNKEFINGTITFSGDGKTLTIDVSAMNITDNRLKNYSGFVESNGYVSMQAANYTRQTNTTTSKWQTLEDVGHAGNVIEALPLSLKSELISIEPAAIKNSAACVQYDFYSFTSAVAEVNIYTLPTHPLNKNYSMRYAVTIDDSPLQIADFKTIGRSEEWKQNVLSNQAIRKIKTGLVHPGKHTLKIYMIDPAVILDRIIINLGGLKEAYGTIAETVRID